MPDPRPDIRCVYFLPKVHYKVPIEFLVPSGASEVIDWHQRSKPPWNGSKTSHGVEGRSSRSPTNVHAYGETWKIHQEDVPAPVDSYRTHLTPLLWAGRSTSFLDLKLQLIIFFSRPELPVARFHSSFTSGEELSTRLGHYQLITNKASSKATNFRANHESLLKFSVKKLIAAKISHDLVSLRTFES